MYLLTFVLLLVGILGIYTEVYAVQISRMFAGQTPIADDMLAWHNAAVSVVTANKAALAAIGTAGCNLSAASCPGGIGVTAAVLPKGYNLTYTWDSYVYQPGGANTQLYVVTWAPPPASGKSSDPVTTPSVGISLSDLYTEIQNDSNIPLLSYGLVSNNQLQTKALGASGAAPIAYSLPTPNGTVSANSVALVALP